MTQNQRVLSVVVGALLFVLLFYRRYLGLNLVIFEIVILIWQLRQDGSLLKRPLGRILLGGTLVTLLATVISHSTYSYFLNFVSILILTGYLVFPDTKSIITSSGLAVHNLVGSQFEFALSLSTINWKGYKPGKLLWRFRIFILPLGVIVAFILIYSTANPLFQKYAIKVWKKALYWITKMIEAIDFVLIVMFILGILVSVILMYRSVRKEFVQYDKEGNDEVQRRAKIQERNFRMKSLLNEYRAAVFLLIVLNALLFILNLFDIKWVWFGFEWEGQYLKQFVHEGTYMLIVSILISIALVLYFFRGNLNFFKHNALLKYLSYVWLVQNGILVFSVALRNYWYIHYFALAYKRIGVIIFLMLTLYGLYSVLVKVRKGKSGFYLFRTNGLAWYIILTLATIPNYDVWIAKYNFSHAGKSFLHLDFMVTLSDKSLPYLDVPLEHLNEIALKQDEKFNYRQKYLSPFKYVMAIEGRKAAFLADYEKSDWLEFNWAEYQAYKKLRMKK